MNKNVSQSNTSVETRQLQEIIGGLKSRIKWNENDTFSRLQLAQILESTGDISSAIENYTICTAFFASRGLLSKARTLQMKVYQLRHKEAKERFEKFKTYKKFSSYNYNRLYDLYSFILFSHLPCEDIIRIDSFFKEKKVLAGSTVIAEGNRSQSLYIILSGVLKVTLKSIREKENVVAKLGKGDFFGEISLITGKPTMKTVTALTDSVILELHKDDYNNLSSYYPELTNILFSYSTGRENSFLFTKSEAIDKRTYDRIKLDCPVSYHLFLKEGTDKGEGEDRGVITDISMGGICIEIDGWDIQCNIIGVLGKTIHVNIELPYEKNNSLQVSGKIKWIKPIDGDNEENVICGIEFADRVTLDIDAIEKLIDHFLIQ